MNFLEVLRFGWKPNELRVLLAAMADPGPVVLRTWLQRTLVPRSDHFGTALRELERLGAVKWEARQEGLAVFVQPVQFWLARPLAEAAEFAAAWSSNSNGQRRLALPTEERSLAEVMASNIPGFRDVSRIPGELTPPERPFSAPTLPDSGIPRDREVLEKEISFPRVPRDRSRGAPENGPADRQYLLGKLKRIPRLEAEVLRPQGEQQQRISRLFWEMASEQPQFLAGVLVDLADSTTTQNKAAWFNRVATEWAKMRKTASEVRA